MDKPEEYNDASAEFGFDDDMRYVSTAIATTVHSPYVYNT
jgi:hypothetical protein